MARSGVEKFMGLYEGQTERTSLMPCDHHLGISCSFMGITHDMRRRIVRVYERSGKVVVHVSKLDEHTSGSWRKLKSVRMSAAQAWEFVQARFPPPTKTPDWDAIIAIIQEDQFVEADAHKYLKLVVDKDTLTAALLDATLCERIHDACQY